MDGAVLVAPDGICYAVGVILDGAASEKGDPGRGARYNSAVRYEESSDHTTVIAVVSEDGGITMVPPIRRRVRRQAIEDIVVAFEAALMSERRGAFADAYKEVQRYAFYLSPEQCARINEVVAQERKRREEAGSIVIVRDVIAPSTDLNDSYFLD